jgi:predicted NodU family carbamoyl transferase
MPGRRAIAPNTRFNKNEPIVGTTEQALDCFFCTNVVATVIDSMLVQRSA